jgi:hypothetical protein
LVPKNGNIESEMTTIQVSDPHAHTLYNCFLVGPKKNTCELPVYKPTSPAVDLSEKASAGGLPGNRGSFIHEELGRQFISGVETIGIRDETTFNPGVFGNDRKVTVQREVWYSPQLDLNLLSVRSDPRNGKQTFTATNVSLLTRTLLCSDCPLGLRLWTIGRLLPGTQLIRLEPNCFSTCLQAWKVQQ